MHITPFLPGLSSVETKSLTATFDAGRLSSDGGLVVLREIEARLGLAETVTGPLYDDRDPARIQHTYAEMAAARMLMIAAGYEDCDDVDTLRTDPALKIAVGRAPETGADLMSQPTLSRLENLADWRALARIGLGQIDLYCNSFVRPPARIVLDIDDTDDPVHGQQELALFNAHYDCTCFQPIHIFDGLSGKPVLSLLRPGKRPSGEEVAKVLRHVIRRIRKRWRHVAVRPAHPHQRGVALLLRAIALLKPRHAQSLLELHPISRHHDLPSCIDDAVISGYYGARRSSRGNQVALSRKNALFAGSDEGAANWAAIASLIETCKLNTVNPHAWLTDTLTKLINRWPASRIDDLMPWAYAKTGL